MQECVIIHKAQHDAVSIGKTKLMDIRVQFFNFNKHYPFLCDWFIKSGKQAPDADVVSSEGLVLEVNETPLAMISIYQTPSKLAFTEFLAVNPQIRGKDRTQILDALSDALDNYAKIYGIKKLFSIVNNNILKKRMIKNGHFFDGDFALMIKEY